VVEAIDGELLRRWCAVALDLLEVHRDELDALNVFPVPDRDTGANLVATMRAASDAVATAGSSTAAVADALASGAARGAQGNSGLIAAEFFRGVAEALTGGAAPVGPAGPVAPAGPKPDDGAALAAGLDAAARRGYAAVALPVEGTALSVIRAAADAAADPGGSSGVAPAASLAGVAARSLAAARAALDRTRAELPALRAAGVVDAGGRGICLLLDALVAVVTESDPAPAPLSGPAAGPRLPPTGSSSASMFEVQFGFAGASAETLRSDLAGIGDSVVVAAVGDGSWRVHVHTTDVGAAIDVALRHGRPTGVQVTPLPPGAAAVAVVALEPGPAGPILQAAGVLVCPAADAARTALSAGSAVVLLVPVAHVATARAAADAVHRAGRDAAVVPVRSPVQAIAAAAVCDPAASFGDNLVAMAESAAATRHGELVVATEAAQTTAGRCARGDVLGLADGDVVVIGPDPPGAGTELLERLLATGGELVTLLGSTDALLDTLATHIALRHPEVEVATHRTGATTMALIGVE